MAYKDPEKKREANRKYYEKNKEKVRESNKKWAEENKEKRREQRKKYYEENKEAIQEKKKKYREENIEKIREYERKRSKTANRIEWRKKYREENKDRLREYHKKQNKKYREENKEKINEYAAQYRQENRDKLLEQMRTYYKKNSDTIRKQNKKYYEENKEFYREANKKYREENREKLNEYRLNRYHNDPTYKLRMLTKNLVNLSLIRGKGGESILPYVDWNSYEELKEHLESQFEDWMTWENHGVWHPTEKRWHIDHIKPQSVLLEGVTSMDDPKFRECWALENLRPLEAENMSKGNKIINE